MVGQSKRVSVVTQQAIRELTDQIVLRFKPERIILFGSHAYGSPDSGSDVDLLIVLPFIGPESARALEIRGEVCAPFPFDLLVKTPESLSWRLPNEDFFPREVTERGKVLYEAPHQRMG